MEPRHGHDIGGRHFARRWTHRLPTDSPTDLPTLMVNQVAEICVTAVFCAKRDHEMAPRPCASSRMEAISADSMASGTLGEPNERTFAEPTREGCLEVESVAWSEQA